MSPDELHDFLATEGLSQRGLARLIGVEASTVGRWLDGTSEVPGYAITIVCMFKYLSKHKKKHILKGGHYMNDLQPEDIPTCPHCDQPIEYGDYTVMSAHGMFYLACGMCTNTGTGNE